MASFYQKCLLLSVKFIKRNDDLAYILYQKEPNTLLVHFDEDDFPLLIILLLILERKINQKITFTKLKKRPLIEYNWQIKQ